MLQPTHIPVKLMQVKVHMLMQSGAVQSFRFQGLGALRDENLRPQGLHKTFAQSLNPPFHRMQ